MKYLKIYENFDFNEDNFDFEEENPNLTYKDYITQYIENENIPGGGFVNGKIYYIEFISNSPKLIKFIEILERNGYQQMENNNSTNKSYIVIWSDNQYSIDNEGGFNNVLNNGTRTIDGTIFIKDAV